MKPKSVEIDGKLVQMCHADCRPPGRIADQVTDATGVWVRLGAEGEWLKNALTAYRFSAIVMAEDTAEEAMAALTGGAAATKAAEPATRPEAAPAVEPKAEPAKARR